VPEPVDEHVDRAVAELPHRVAAEVERIVLQVLILPSRGADTKPEAGARGRPVPRDTWKPHLREASSLPCRSSDAVPACSHTPNKEKWQWKRAPGSTVVTASTPTTVTSHSQPHRQHRSRSSPPGASSAATAKEIPPSTPSAASPSM